MWCKRFGILNVLIVYIVSEVESGTLLMQYIENNANFIFKKNTVARSWACDVF